jgi:hypothetical protein
MGTGAWELLVLAVVFVAIAFVAVARSKAAERQAVRFVCNKLGLERVVDATHGRPILRGNVDGVAVEVLWGPPEGKSRGTVTRVIAEVPGADRKALEAARKRFKAAARLPFLSRVETWKKGILVTVNANVGADWEPAKLVVAIRQLIEATKST